MLMKCQAEERPVCKPFWSRDRKVAGSNPARSTNFWVQNHFEQELTASEGSALCHVLSLLSSARKSSLGSGMKFDTTQLGTGFSAWTVTAYLVLCSDGVDEHFREGREIWQSLDPPCRVPSKKWALLPREE